MVTINAATLSNAAANAPQPPGPPSTSTPDTRSPGDLAKNLPIDGAIERGAPTEEARPVNLEELNQAVEQLENTAKLANRSVHFRISDEGDDIQVLVINEETDEVIREIPPDAAVELAERIQGTLGLLIDKVV